ncbi:MAG: hypothetical protein IT572_08175 [Deltaproteobacteria bacterium]|nr:hypothetical protein [Deltaproteobacteria bacterium]
MNVYSIRLIPSLKLKLCQFLGIASTMAVDELAQRLDRLELKIDRLDVQMRRSSRRQLVLPAPAKTEASLSVKKKPSRPARVAASKPPKAKPHLAEVTPLARPEPALGDLVAVTEVTSPVSSPVVAEAPASLEEAVILIAAEEGTRRAVQDYFGPRVTVIEVEGVQHLERHFEGRRILAVVFDRALLGQEAAREALEPLSRTQGGTRWIGLSSYLTLAFAEAMPQREDFATFLTRPLSAGALAGVFGAEPEAAISAAGRTDPA